MLDTCCRKKYFGISYGRAQTFYAFRSLLVQFFYNSLFTLLSFSIAFLNFNPFTKNPFKHRLQFVCC